VVAAFTTRQDSQHFCKVIDNNRIAEENYNLSVSTYVEQEDTREVINIVKLNAEIDRIVARSEVLRKEIATIIAEIEGEEE
jgi:type I restriction enzyme M protein